MVTYVNLIFKPTKYHNSQPLRVKVPECFLLSFRNLIVGSKTVFLKKYNEVFTVTCRVAHETGQVQNCLADISLATCPMHNHTVIISSVMGQVQSGFDKISRVTGQMQNNIAGISCVIGRVQNCFVGISFVTRSMHDHTAGISFATGRIQRCIARVSFATGAITSEVF
jgi:hypothetical protein